MISCFLLCNKLETCEPKKQQIGYKGNIMYSTSKVPNILTTQGSDKYNFKVGQKKCLILH